MNGWRKFCWGFAGLLLMGLSVGARAQTTVEYVHTDALGSPVAVTNAAGAVIERTDYEPYGSMIGKPNYSGVGFTGHVQDGETGLTYMQQRYYDPMIGRFLSVDPVTAYEKPTTNFNRYVYTINNPYKFTDPDGRDVECDGTTCHIRSQNAGEFLFIDLPHYALIRTGTAALDATLSATVQYLKFVNALGRLFDNSESSEAGEAGGKGEAPDLPTELVGDNPRATGKNGGTAVGTSLSGDRFPEVVEGLTGGTLGAPNDKGRSVAPNGVSVRTGGSNGPRVDIPANGTKPPEIIHFPPDTPIPENLKPQP